MDERYMYTVIPKIPIRGLIKGKSIIRSENLSLSKSEVLYCIKFGQVYRKFYEKNRKERVFPSNLDRLHRKDYISEKEYNTLTEKCYNVDSGFFDTKDSETTNTTVGEYEKKTTKEDQFLSGDNTKKESLSQESSVGSDQESCDNNVVDESTDIINDTENVESSDDENTEPEYDVESYDEDIESSDDEKESGDENLLTPTQNNIQQSNNVEYKNNKKKKRKH